MDIPIDVDFSDVTAYKDSGNYDHGDDTMIVIPLHSRQVSNQ